MEIAAIAKRHRPPGGNCPQFAPGSTKNTSSQADAEIAAATVQPVEAIILVKPPAAE